MSEMTREQVIEAMLEAYDDCPQWTRQAAMTAAVAVHEKWVLDQVCAYPTDEEWIAVVGRDYDCIPLSEALKKCAFLIHNRRARFERTPSLEDKILELIRTNKCTTAELVKQIVKLAKEGQP